MGLSEYREYQELTGHSFYALIMAAMAGADTDNLEKLQQAFPEVWKELQARYNAPGGALTPQEYQAVLNWIEERENEDES